MACDHSASHSGGARFLRKSGKLQLLLVCDTCGAERARLGRIEYRPDPRRLVVQIAEQIARELGLEAAQTKKVRFAALVCGLARNRIDPAILHSRGPLSEAEWVQMRRQPELAAALLSDASMDDVREWILCHRERPDGSGYPRGLVGGQIPLEARIIASPTHSRRCSVAGPTAGRAGTTPPAGSSCAAPTRNSTQPSLRRSCGHRSRSSCASRCPP